MSVREPSSPGPDPQSPFQLVLASSSPRRREFLQAFGVPFQVVPPDQGVVEGGLDESPLPGEAPPGLVQRLSHLKARTVAAGLPFYSTHPNDTDIRVPNVIVSADTVVALDDRILGKPRDPAEATDMLKLLRRQAHAVYSGLTVAYCKRDRTSSDRGWQFITHMHQSKVWMRPYSDAEIADYVAGGSPLDKAGAYGIQDRPFAPVEQLDGCFASVMGLPLGELTAALKSINLTLPEVAPLCAGITGTSCCQVA